MFGRLDLVASRLFLVARLGEGGNIAANADQIAPEGEVMNDPSIVRRIGRRRGAVHEIRKIAHAAEIFEGGIAMELFGQQNRFGQMPTPNMALDCGEQAPMEGLIEVGRRQGVAEAFGGAIIIEQNAQQGLFGLEIGGSVGDVEDRSRRA